MAVNRPLAPAVNRAVEILDLVAAEPRRLGISAIARRLGLPKSSVANVCGALTETGMLRNHPEGYGLGQHLAQLGAAYLAGIDHVQLFNESCSSLDVAAGDTVQLAMLTDALDVMYLARHEGVYPVRLASTIGRPLPATCTATGKAILAQLDPDELDARLGPGPLPMLTKHSIATVDELHEILDEVRSSGRAFDREEVIEGVVCVAVAIPGPAHSGHRMAISATLLAPRATNDLLDQITAELHVVAQLISVGLGGQAVTERSTG